MVQGLPNMFGSVDGGEQHGIGIGFFGPLSLPLMIGFLCMLGTTIWFYVKARSAAEDFQKFYYVAMSVTGIASVAYLCMRANIGISYVECAGGSCLANATATQSYLGKAYPLFWMRYIDWFFTTPFFLLDLCLLAGVEKTPDGSWETFFVMLLNAICIICGAVGALKPSVSIPFFVLGMLTFVGFIQKLWGLSKDQHYQLVMKLTMGIWCAYPVMFYLCEMTHSVTTELEVWLYCILDVAAKCGCGVLLVSGHEKYAALPSSEYGAVL
jgi:bacteriorhodopsin